MKTIGILGGMSWVSTIEYYRIINEEVMKRLGPGHSAQILVHSFNSKNVYGPMAEGKDDVVIARFHEAISGLKQAGADFVLLGANTAHMYAEHVEEREDLPLIHIADATAEQISKQSLTKIGLLGTRYTMERDFYKQRLQSHGITTLTPDESDRALISRVINDELCQSIITEESKAAFLKIIQKLESEGAQGVILGCTEIPLLVKQADYPLPMFDTTRIHSLAAVERALAPT